MKVPGENEVMASYFEVSLWGLQLLLKSCSLPGIT